MLVKGDPGVCSGGGVGGRWIWGKIDGSGSYSVCWQNNILVKIPKVHILYRIGNCYIFPGKNKRALLLVFMRRNQWHQTLLLQLIDLVPRKLLYINSHCFSGGYDPGKLLLIRVNWASYADINVWISVFTFNSFLFDWRRQPSWWRFTAQWERMSFRGIFADEKIYISYPVAYFMLEIEWHRWYFMCLQLGWGEGRGLTK